jgi:MoaA/NifB/PqqE/SkfB family radical SAM enzyme
LQERDQQPELTTNSWYKIIDYFKESFSTSVGFIITGGEPLMHPDLFKIGSHIKKCGMRWEWSLMGYF